MDSINKEQILEYINQEQLGSAKTALREEVEREMETINGTKPALEKKKTYFAHYTSLDTIYSILKNHNETNPTYLRLYNASSLNDPSEGDYLKDRLKRGRRWLASAKQDTEAYICSFVSGDKTVGNKLAYWQAYGKDGLGCSIQLSPDYTYKEELRDILYGEKGVQDINIHFKTHFELAKIIYSKLPRKDKKSYATEFWKAFDGIRFLYKHDDYEHEKEYRCVVVHGSNTKVEYHLKSEGPYLRRYIEDDKLLASKILDSGSTVFIGPRVKDVERFRQNLTMLARQANLHGPIFKPSGIPYQKVW